MGHESPTRRFIGASVEECQDHFDNLRNNKAPKGQGHRRRYSRQLAEIDVDREFNALMTVIHRDTIRLLDKSHEGPLTGHEAKTVIEYARLMGSLRRQVHKDLGEMDNAELEKLAKKTDQVDAAEDIE